MKHCLDAICNFEARDFNSVRDHFIQRHLPKNLMYAPVKTKVAALLRLSKEATGENSLGAAADLVQDLRPEEGILMWSTPESTAAREVFDHFYPGGRLRKEEMRNPGKWTLMNWECLAYLLNFVGGVAKNDWIRDFTVEKPTAILRKDKELAGAIRDSAQTFQGLNLGETSESMDATPATSNASTARRTPHNDTEESEKEEEKAAKDGEESE